MIASVVALSDCCLWRLLYGIDRAVGDNLTVRLRSCTVARYVSSLSALVAHFAGRIEWTPIGCGAVTRDMTLLAISDFREKKILLFEGLLAFRMHSIS